MRTITIATESEANLRKLILIAVIVGALGCTTTTSSTQPQGETANERLTRVLEQYFEEALKLNPVLATSIGDNRYNDRLAVTISDSYRAENRSIAERYRAEVSGIQPGGLTEQNRLSREIFIRNLENTLEGYKYPSHLVPLNQFFSTPSSFAQLGSGTGIHPFKTVKDYDDFLARISGFEKWVDTAISRMREGVAAGVVQPRVLMERTLPQLEAHVVSDVKSSLFHKPIENFPVTFTDAEKQRLTGAYERAIRDRVVPAYSRLHRFVRDEYLPNTRSTVGLSAQPNGRNWYSYLVEGTTTTKLTPDEIHETGLREVARIHSEMERVKKEVGFEGDLQAFFKYLETDPRFYFSDREDLLEGYRDIKRRVDALTPRLFDVIPKQDYEVRPVEPFREKSAAGGSYTAATPDGSRPGIFYANTYDMKSRPKYAMEALSLHEGAPGHHFQISIQQALEELPRFRRFGAYTAYIEGWGLYAESLGKELGVYTDPYQYYGKLDAELWRAIRLVLDTGIHHQGWSREQAIDYALLNSSNGETRTISEVERFIAIPSQALAYKIGQLKITELRQRAEKALGPKFNLKTFHREILEDGALPLDVLELKINRWIAEQK